MDSRTRAIDAQLSAGVAVFRAAAWVWLAVVAAVSTNRMARPVLGWVAVSGTGLVTAWLSWLALGGGREREPDTRVSESAVGLWADVVCAVALLVADGWVYSGARPQSLAGAWPVAAVLAVAVVWGRRGSLLVALAFGGARFAGQVGLVGAPGTWPGGTWLSVLSSTVLYALAGVAAAEVARRVRDAEDAVADARARERVARDMHDGMLQTLAAIQRRSDDPQLVNLARSQESELRSYLFAPLGTDPGAPDSSRTGHQGAERDAESFLRGAVADATRRWGIGVQVALASPLPGVSDTVGRALSAAVGECFANVAKHAGTDRANLFAEGTSEGLTVVVRDRGVGFDPAAVTQRGIAHSLNERICDVGGRVALRSTPTSGTEVRITVPSMAGGSR